MIRVFIETGRATTSEHVFMTTYLRHIGLANGDFEIINVGGKDKLHLAHNQFKKSFGDGAVNLVVFDADFPGNHGGYEQRAGELRDLINRLGVDADIFLFPDNSADGDFETLLERIALHDRHAGFFGCFNDYECCLGPNYVAPNRKGKMFTYISSMPMTKSCRDMLGRGEWMFDNRDYWDLDSESLEPLKQFIRAHI